MRKLGVGYRHEISPWIFSQNSGIECLELTAEHFYYDRNIKTLKKLRNQIPLCVHGLGLSLGTPGPLSSERLRQFQRVVEICEPDYISEHVSFTRTQSIDLGHLTPVQYSQQQLDIFVEHAQQLMSICNKPLLLENITSHLNLVHEMDEPDFLNELCARSGCGLLLDVTNLYINSVNHHFDPYLWLNKIKKHYVKQLHVVGFTESKGILFDSHSEDLKNRPQLQKLIATVYQQFNPELTIIERDEHFPETKNLNDDLLFLKNLRSEYAFS